MSPIASLRATAVLSLLLAACASTPVDPVARSGPVTHTVLLVSLDGVHPDQLERAGAPSLSRLARQGVQAEWMTPSYPSLTFPNHYTLVTGLRPDRHGIVHNVMHSADLGWFTIGDRDTVGDRRWWGGEPLWVTAEKAGIPTATLFWPGSEAPVGGVRPTRWKAFDSGLPMAERVDQVLDWLSEPAATRPRFATLYLEHPDTAGHRHGPGSPELRATMRAVDAQVGRLVAGIERAGLAGSVDLVIVSDHGMAPVLEGNVVTIEEMADPEDAEPLSFGQVVGFRPLPGRTPAAEAALLGAHERYDCWRKEDLPARWHYGRHPRVPPIICQLHEGWDALPERLLAPRPPGTRGSHGYDPALPSMRAVFIAHGPSFASGMRLPPFDNVDVYPLLARLLGLDPVDGDGDPEALLPALRRP